MDLKESIVGIAVGIRYTRSFRIPDILGEIIDNILADSSSPFNTKYFPKIHESSREKMLFNPETDEYLRINTDDLILGIKPKVNFTKSYEWLRTDVISYINENIFRKYNINNINRIGIIFIHKLGKSKLLNKVITDFTKEKLENPDYIDLLFSQKQTAVESLYRKSVNDYKNAIYNIVSLKDGFIAQLDYQYCYEPVVEDIRDCKPEKVFEDAINFLDKEFYSWLSEYVKPKK